MATRETHLGGALLAAMVLLVLLASGGAAQEEPTARVVPTNEVVITGYGTVGYAFGTQGENENAFTTSISPIFLFQFQDRVLFEAEFEFELTEGVTETGLEYAQLDLLLHDNFTLVGGKFLLPFGIFGERLHPTWINKFPTSPPLYGHHVAAFGAEPLVPIISDIGVMGRGVLSTGPVNVSATAYVTQGPAAEDETAAIAELIFPASSSDNNNGKMVGGRLDLSLPPDAELNVSYFNGDYDELGVLDLTGWNVAAEVRRANLEIRGEYIQTRQEVETPAGFPTVKRHGFYAQVAYRVGPWEPVFRWTQVFDAKLNGQTQQEGAWQAGFGLDYWLSPSIAVMAGYELNREDVTELDNDRIVLHIAYGF